MECTLELAAKINQNKYFICTSQINLHGSGFIIVHMHRPSPQGRGSNLEGGLVLKLIP